MKYLSLYNAKNLPEHSSKVWPQEFFFKFQTLLHTGSVAKRDNGLSLRQRRPVVPIKCHSSINLRVGAVSTVKLHGCVLAKSFPLFTQQKTYSITKEDQKGAGSSAKHTPHITTLQLTFISQ